MNPDKVDQLTAAELAVLRLLATGHDTQSAADSLGISIHAVNDRLREARRKLGVTSSRAAARMVAAQEMPQEIRPDFSGEDRAAQTAEAATHRRWTAWIAGGIVMIGLAAVAVFWGSLPAASQEPRVISVFPAGDQTVAAGPYTLRVTFDRPMQNRSWSFVQTSRGTYPECDGKPVRSADGRSFTMQCVARAGRAYEIWFNKAPYLNFKSADGRAARPFGLRFRTR